MGMGNIFGVPGKAETEILTAVLLQMGMPFEPQTYEDMNKNIDAVFAMIDRASMGMPGFDIAITPEVILTGGGTPVAIKKNSKEMQRLKDKCKELKIWGVFGAQMDFEDGNPFHNVAITINDEGEIVNIYSKTTPWTPNEPSYPGDEIQVFEGPKGSRIATIICSDGDYQDSWREAASKGANVIIRISDYMVPGQDAWEITNRAGAYFNRAYVLATNTACMDSSYCLFGKSMAVDPEGKVMTMAPEGINYILKADIYPGLLDHIRNNSLANDFLWAGNHRGATCPAIAKEGGRNKDMYTYLQKEIKHE